MFKLEINKRIADFDGSISIVLNSPVFSDDLSYSLQFNLESTENNRLALGFINKPDISDNKSRELPCRIIADALLLEGTIIASWQGGAFNCYFKEAGTFFTAIKDKNLSDIVFDDIEITDINTFVENYNSLEDADFVFPRIHNAKIAENYPVVVQLWTLMNYFNAGKLSAISPALRLRYIYKSIFEKNNVAVTKDPFSSNIILNRLILPSNHLLNKFYIDKTVTTSITDLIGRISNTENPEVECIRPHGLTTNDLIIISGITQLPLAGKVYQVEVSDDLTFSLKGEDFTAYEEFKTFIGVLQQETKTYGTDPGDVVIQVQVDVPLGEWTSLYMVSDDWAGIVSAHNWATHPDPNQPWVDLEFNDPDREIHNYANIKLINRSPNGTISTITGISSSFDVMNPAKHMPAIKINEFLKNCNLLGLYYFVTGNQVEIHQMKDILLSKEFTDISRFASIINDVENYAKDGYNLKMDPDGNDEYYKQKLPVQVIGNEYTIKPAVASSTFLPVTGSETNDVRLVENQHTWYVFNKSFLNAENGWKVLTHDLLDMRSGKEDIKFSTKFSPLMTGVEDVPKYPRMDVNCECDTFANLKTPMAPRLLTWFGMIDYVGAQIPYASSFNRDPDGNAITGETFQIKWDGAGGLYETFWKEYMHWLLYIRKDCKLVVQWPVYLLSNFKFFRKYRIRGTDYLVKSIKITLNFKKSRIDFNETEAAKV